MLKDQDAAGPAAGQKQREAFEQGVRMCAQWLWQEASSRQRRKYPQYAMSSDEFLRVSREYQRKVRDKEAADLGYIRKQLGCKAELTEDGQHSKHEAYIAGEDLRCVSFFLCTIGDPAGPGDAETLLRGKWDPIATQKTRRLIRSYEGRSVLMTFLNGQLDRASKDLEAIASQRGVLPSAYYRFDSRGDFAIDQEVLDTNYFMILSIVRFVEGEPGNA